MGTSFGITTIDHQAKGMTLIPVNQLPSDQKGAGLAFKFREPGWNLTVVSQLSSPWVQAEGTHVIHLDETRMNVQCDFDYAIQNAPVSRFHIVLPENAENISFTGTGIRQKDHKGPIWSIVLQSRVSGSYRLSASYDIPISPDVQKVAVPLAKTRGPEREQGVILISSIPSLHVAEQKRSKQVMLRTNVRNLSPDVVERSRGISRLAYRYLRRDNRLVLRLQRYETAETLEANIGQAKLTSVFAEDGQMMTLATYTMRNNIKQHLQLELPEGNELWSCYVAGEPVRATVHGSKILIPIIPVSEDEPAYRIQFNYVGTLPPVKAGRKIKMTAPKMDLPIQNTRWEVYLPKGYRYSKFRGNSTHREDVGVILREFGLGEYRSALISESVAKKRKVRELIARAEKMVRKGDISGARRQYRQAKHVGIGKKEIQGGLRNLSQIEAYANVCVDNLRMIDNKPDFKKAVRKGWDVQSSRSRTAKQTDQQAQFTKQLQIAEQQAERIRKIHAASVKKPTQLRISLPVEGYRYIFEHILWVPGDEPVSITMKAALERKEGIFHALPIIAVGFIFVAVFTGGWVRRSRIQILIGTALLGSLYVYIVLM